MSKKAKQKEVVLYYGSEKVLGVEEGYKENIKRIKTEKWADDFPSYELEASLSTQPISLSDLRNNRLNVVAQKTMQLWLDLNLRLEDLGPLMQKLVNTIQQNEQKAILKLYGLMDKNDLRLEHLEEVLKKETPIEKVDKMLGSLKITTNGN